MRPGARTPEELETLFEDTFVVRDREALAGLFEDGAVLFAGDLAHEARGGDEIARWATAMWQSDRTYVADPRQVLQARDIALVVAGWGINVAHRGGDGVWRYAISLLSLDDTTMKEDLHGMQDTSQPQPDPVVIRADHDEVDERRESWERP